MAISAFDPRTLLGVWEETGKRAKSFFREMFFKNIYQSTTEHIDLDYVQRRRILAPFVALDGPGKTVDRSGFKNDSYIPPALKPRMVMKQRDLQKRIAGESISQALSPTQRDVALTQRDMQQLHDMISRRVEWMCAQTMFGGKVVMAGDDYSETLDFNLTTKETLTNTALWSASTTATPLTDLERWMLAVAEKTGVMPNKCIMAANVAQAFMKCTQVINESAKFQNILLKIEPTPLAEYPGASSIGWYMTPTGFQIEVIVYTEYYDTVAANGTVTTSPMVPAGQLVLANPVDSFVLAYGAYIDMTSDPAETYSVAEFPRQWADPNTNIRFLEMVSRPLTAPTLPDAWYWATVL